MTPDRQTNKEKEMTLGMNLSELTLRDICEEITDIKRDISVIEDYQNGIISYSEMMRDTMMNPDDLESLKQGLATLQEEKRNRQ